MITATNECVTFVVGTEIVQFFDIEGGDVIQVIYDEKAVARQILALQRALSIARGLDANVSAVEVLEGEQASQT